MKNIKTFDKWVLNESFITKGTSVENFIEKIILNSSVDASSNPLVLVIDTSPNNSFRESQKFVSEVLNTSNSLGVSEVIIIYTGGRTIDDVDYVKRGDKPDFSKTPQHRGATSMTYDLAFDWIQKNDIDPLGVIYLTLGLWEYPSVGEYGISSYEDRILWAIVDPNFTFATYSDDPSDRGYRNDLRDANIPPFGEYAIIGR